MAEAGSFAGAAERLNMTLSAVSMQMRGLEDEIGAALFDRSFRPARLTPEGRAAVDRAREAVSACERLSTLSADAALRGIWRLGFVPSAAVRILPAFLARAGREAPDAEFHVETGLSDPLARRVADGALDAAVVTGASPETSGLSARLLAEEEIVFALPPDCPLEPEAALARIPFLQFPPPNGIGRLVAGALERRGIVPARPLFIDGIEPAVECARLGVGMTALPEPDIRRWAGDSLRLVPMETPPLRRRLILVARPEGQPGARLDALAGMMRGSDEHEACRT